MRILALKKNAKYRVANLEEMLELENQQLETLMDKIQLGSENYRISAPKTWQVISWE